MSYHAAAVIDSNQIFGEYQDGLVIPPRELYIANLPQYWNDENIISQGVIPADPSHAIQVTTPFRHPAFKQQAITLSGVGSYLPQGLLPDNFRIDHINTQDNACFMRLREKLTALYHSSALTSAFGETPPSLPVIVLIESIVSLMQNIGIRFFSDFSVTSDGGFYGIWSDGPRCLSADILVDQDCDILMSITKSNQEGYSWSSGRESPDIKLSLERVRELFKQ